MVSNIGQVIYIYIARTTCSPARQASLPTGFSRQEYWAGSHSLRRRQWHPTPVLLPGKSHGQRSLEGCNPWGCWGSDTTERLHFHFSLWCIGEGNGNPLQCSCLENPRDGGAWWAAIYGVAQSQTRLKWLGNLAIAIPFSCRSSWPREQTWVSHTAGRLFTIWATREAPTYVKSPTNSYLLWCSSSTSRNLS